MFKEVDPKQSFPKMEEEILKFWQNNNIFKKTLKKDSPKGNFVFFEGPPTANGKPGIHHVLARAFKDLIPRYKTMQGFHVDRKAGWDTHGLPVELEVEKKLGISGKPQIEKYGIKKFNAECKKSVWFYKDEWEKITERIAFWLDLEHPYVTYENDYIESVWWIVKQIWDKKLLYQGHKVVPQCPRCGTALSSHEVAQGYKKITETSVYIKFPLKNEKNTYVLAWTTTPWTLPGNVALALGKNIDYVKVEQDDDFYILAKDRVKILQGNYKIIKNLKAKDLEGMEYQPLFEFINLAEKTGQKAYYLTSADFVTTEEGTGVVHTAVMYGEDDYTLGDKIDLPKYHTVNENGRFTDEVKPWAGEFVKDVEKDIIEYFKNKNLLYKTEAASHEYPFCWRCGTPLIYYAKNSWFIKMSALKKELIANNSKINWIPAYIKNGRFGEWLKEVKDWAISRERYWGTPLPIWRCNKCAHTIVIGSIKEAEDLSGKKLTDLHRPFIDEISFKCEKCSGKMERVKEVMDCWFDSGAMPFAQYHYPFENKKSIDDGISYPADYICEAIDQTRGWFYTLLAISTLLDKKASYKNVICLGHILDSHGQKMSKSRGNVINPWEVIDEFGADALRYHLYSMNQPGEVKRFDKKNLSETLRKNLIILWNVYGFFITYANIDGWSKKAKSQKLKAKSLLDQWVLARLDQLVETVGEDLDKYDIFHASREISFFIDELSTWYLRRSRKRRDNEFYGTMHQVLITLSKVLAPFTPFIAESIYQNLKDKNNPESVHLCNWSIASTQNQKSKIINQKLLDQMQKVREIVEKTHALRAEAGIKVRQPLAKISIIDQKLSAELLDIIADEVNVKKVEIDSHQKEEILLDTKITSELRAEGEVRELLRQIQVLRKKKGLKPDDEATLYFQSPDKSLVKSLELVKEKVLVKKIIDEKRDDMQELEIGGKKVKISLS